MRAEALGQPGREEAIVPLAIELSDARRILVVTGPNAGGKTVSLKTTGVLALMAMCGLPIPAATGSRVPFLSPPGGDRRRRAGPAGRPLHLQRRLLRLKEAWEAAGPDSLVLLDELGSGTDPEEGAALSSALLEGLLEKGSLGIITTHLAQLAAAALEYDGASCAAMEFDPNTGRPTFHLLPGPPGASEALALARRLGLPAEWLDLAEERLGSEHRDLRRLIAEVERVRQELTETRERLETEHEDAVKLRRRLAEERAALEEERRSTGKKMRTRAGRLRRQTSERLRREEERLRERFDEGRRRGLAAEAVQTLFAEAPAFVEEAAGARGGPLAVGQTVRHVGLGWTGVLEKLEPGKAEVLVRGKRVRCRPDELAPSGTDRKEREAPSPAAREMRSVAGAARGTTGDIDEAASVPPEINLIGMRVEPALEELESYIDRAMLASRKEVRVIHGHGSGRLRQAVRQYLRAHRGIAEIRSGAPNEGGDGATIVTFRGG